MVHTEPPEEPENTPRELSDDDLFHILSNQRRRYVLHYLTDCESPVEMRNLTNQVAAWEHKTTVEALNSTQRQRVYIPLYQNHLPKLAAHDIITYNQSRGYVEAKPLLSQLLPYLDDQRAHSRDRDQTQIQIPLRGDIPSSIREIASISAITTGVVFASRMVPTRFLTILVMVAVILFLGAQRI